MTDTDRVELETSTGTTVRRADHRWSEDDKRPCDCVAPQSHHDLDFEPQPMVGWFRPSGLIKAGIEAAVSSTFGSYADKRDVQAVLTEPEWHDYSGEVEQRGDIWIDYIADLGDGWDPTYTMARLLAEPELWFDEKGQGTGDPDKAVTRTQRGRVLNIHDNEVLLCQSDPDYKNFLRMHIDKNGKLTIYPIGVQKVNRRNDWSWDKTERRLAAWRLQPDAKDGQAWFEPAEGVISDLARLIEEPVTIEDPRCFGA